MPRRSALQTRKVAGGGIKEIFAAIGNATGVLQDPPMFPNELHLRGMNYTGPGTQLEMREKAGPPYNQPSKLRGPIMEKVDAAAKEHDYDYKNAGEMLKSGDIGKDQFVSLIHAADDVFINTLKNIPGMDLTKATAMKAIQLKKFLEQSNIMDTATFSGAGINALATLKPARMLWKERDKRYIQGGFLPIAAPLIYALATGAVSGLAEEGVKALIRHFSKSDHDGASYGSGLVYKPDMSTDDQMKYLVHAIDNTSPARQVDLLHKLFIKDKK